MDRPPALEGGTLPGRRRELGPNGQKHRPLRREQVLRSFGTSTASRWIAKHVMHHLLPSRAGERLVRSAFVILLGCAGARPASQTQPGDADLKVRASPDAAAPSAAPEEPRPDSCARAGASAPGSAEDLWKVVQAARAEVGNLREADFGDRSQRAAALLRAMAEAFVQSPYARPNDATRICEITEQADALVADEGEPFQGSAQIKRGLTIAVELLEEQISRAGREHLDPWLQTARRAVQSIDEEGMVSFQEAPIQDAFRAAVDALTLFAQTTVFSS